MITQNNDFYDENAIHQAEKNTERGKAKRELQRVKKFISSKLFKDLDFPPDEDELDDKIEGF